MASLLNIVKEKIVFLGAVIVAAIVGGATSAVVVAAIPDSNGQINACYKNNTKVLSVTDPAGNCSNGETALSWPQQGGVKAYARILDDGTIDTANSHNITSVVWVPADEAGHGNAYCINTSIPIQNIVATNETNQDVIRASLNTGSDFWNQFVDRNGDGCAADTDAAVVVPQPGPFYISMN